MVGAQGAIADTIWAQGMQRHTLRSAGRCTWRAWFRPNYVGSSRRGTTANTGCLLAVVTQFVPASPVGFIDRNNSRFYRGDSVTSSIIILVCRIYLFTRWSPDANIVNRFGSIFRSPVLPDPTYERLFKAFARLLKAVALPEKKLLCLTPQKTCGQEAVGWPETAVARAKSGSTGPQISCQMSKLKFISPRVCFNKLNGVEANYKYQTCFSRSTRAARSNILIRNRPFMTLQPSSPQSFVDQLEGSTSNN